MTDSDKMFVEHVRPASPIGAAMLELLFAHNDTLERENRRLRRNILYLQVLLFTVNISYFLYRVWKP